jgi:hypothetical protein
MLIVTFNVKAQTSTILGKWRVVDVEYAQSKLSKEEKQKVEMIKGAFKRSHFEFKTNNMFSFDFEEKDMNIKNAHWKYDSKNASYIIQEWKDKDEVRSVLMEIAVKNKNGKIFFLLTETPFVLEVTKTN